MKKYYLDKIIGRLEQFINADANEETIKAKDVTDFLRDEIVLILQKAILSGEYYKDEEYGSCDRKIDSIEQLIKNLTLEIAPNELQEVSKKAEEIEKKESVTEDDPKSFENSLKLFLDKTFESNNEPRIREIIEKIILEFSHSYEDQKIEKSPEIQNNNWRTNIDNKSFNKSTNILLNKYLNLYRTLIKTVDDNLINFSNGQQGELVDIAILQGFSMLADYADLILNSILETDDTDVDIVSNYYTFQVTLLATYLDEYLECKEGHTKVLQSIMNFLPKLKKNKFNEDILPALESKVEFLLHKINYRYNHVNHEKESIGSEYKKLNSGNLYAQFSERINLHYGSYSDNFVVSLEKQIEQYKKSPIGDLRMEPFHHLNRYYNKLCTKSLPYRKNKIDALASILVNKREDFGKLTLYNQIAFTSVLKLLWNSSLKLDLQSQVVNEYPDIIPSFRNYISGQSNSFRPDFLDKRESTVHSLIQEGGFDDYYCSWLLLRFVYELIEFLIKKPDLLIDDTVRDTEEIDKKNILERIEMIKSYLDKLYNQTWVQLVPTLHRMITHESKPVYLFKEECEIKSRWPSNNEETVLFLDSSYILPNDFEKFQRKIENGKVFLSPQLNHLKDAVTVSINQLIVEKEVEKSEKKAKETEFRAVQIVALFVTIATFVLASVKIFENKTSGLESIGIILGLASSLAMFNLFFHFMILRRGKRESVGKVFIEIWWLLVIPIVFGTISLLILMGIIHN